MYCITVVAILVSICHLSQQHGRVMEPPARNTLWRFGFPAPANYEDSQLFCGGLKTQWEVNNDICGVCGDPYNGERIHETGGFMARNITSRQYIPGTTLDVVIDLVANHHGTFQFQMCYRDSWDQIETEDCFENLKLADGSDGYVLGGRDRSGTGLFVIPVQLPEKTCENCILRWHWKAANNWGLCENRMQAVGCGPQETYRNCADIALKYESGIRGPLSNPNEIEEFAKFRAQPKY